MRPGRVFAFAAGFAAAGALSGALAMGAWRSVIEYRTPYRFETLGEPGFERDWRVLLVVVDGLREDASRRMRGIERLRQQGADLTASVGLPSYSRPGRASLVTGSLPEIHGATSNRHRGTVALDNLFRGVSRTKGDVAILGSDLWRSLFAPDLGKAYVRESDVKEEPGGFERRLPEIMAFEWQAAGELLARRPRVGVIDLIAPDYAAHEHGARSPEYGRACEYADRVIQRIADEVDLWRTLVVVTADHGHLDTGGHGGDEPEVLAAPLVFAGRGVRAGVRGHARQADVAPTVAALLGLPIPAGSEGRVLTDVLDFEDDAAFRDSVVSREAAQQAAFRRDLAKTLGVAEAEPAAMRALRQEQDEHARLPLALLALAAAAAAFAAAFRRQLPQALACAAAGALVEEAAFRWLVAARLGRLTLSAINYDDGLKPYFLQVLGTALVATLVALAVVTLARSRGGSASAADAGFAAAFGIGLFLLAPMAVIYWRQGIEMTWTIGSVSKGFEGVVDLGRLCVVGVAAVVVPLFAAAFSRLRAPSAAAAAGLLLLLAPSAQAGAIHDKVPDAADPKARWMIYLHGRIVEVQGRAAVSPDFGPYQFDAITKALSGGGFELVAELRPETTTLEYAGKVAGQVRKLKAAGVPASHIVVVGFSKGGYLTRRAASLVADPEVRYVVMAGCGRTAESPEPWTPKMAGRVLSIYDESDELAGSCKPAFAKAPAVKGEEILLKTGKRHGTFFDVRPEWLDPVMAFATR